LAAAFNVSAFANSTRKGTERPMIRDPQRNYSPIYAIHFAEGMMNRLQHIPSRLPIVIAAAALAWACGTTSTKFTSTWKPAGAQPVSAAGMHVAVVFIHSNRALRRTGENALAEQLARYGAISIPSYRIMPDRPGDREVANRLFKQAGIDAVVTMRVVKRDQSVTYTPDFWTVSPVHSSLWGYWAYGWDSAYGPGYLQTETRVGVETLLYSVAEDRLLWAGSSETFDPHSVKSAVRQIAKKAVAKMNEERVLLK
jgi:hypothetical protein